MPITDASQDWLLLHDEEINSFTVLKFVRKIETCDTTYDITIPVYPTSEDTISYHGTTRGTKSMSLLRKVVAPQNFPDDVLAFDFLNNDYLLPNATTTYLCKGFFLTDLHHMIKFKPVITPCNEKTVHHIHVNRCQNVNRTQSENAQRECIGGRPPAFPSYCRNTFIAWAIGGEKTGVIGNSGIRITLTKQFRRNEASLLEIGVTINPYHVIPPGLPAFISSGYCTDRCISEALKHSNVQEPLAYEPAYDFNFQELRSFPEETPIRPDGFSTLDEMCVAYIYFYPAKKVTRCESKSKYPVITSIRDR
ncbi:hypothetical protein DPMN_047151 [Dreissena polymorpha]|uniref:Uncharacterized protein n=1 Tax=Dreissena polymorpha TaxID=45954 RepID=A0A9D4D879_DREPO|nr:hypothetical protein DPMN_047151 [Dreissena polymorpha]